MLFRSFDGMESWLPWLTADERLLPDLLPAGAVVTLIEPRRLRDRATDLLAEEASLADALAVMNGRSLDGEPEKLIQQAVKLDPGNVKALALAGTIAFNRDDFKTAVDYWQRAVDRSEPGSDFAQQLQGAVAEARQRVRVLAGAVLLPHDQN